MNNQNIISEYKLALFNLLIEQIRFERTHNICDNKDLWFLDDATPERRLEWLSKAIITAEYHNFISEGTFVTYIRGCKTLMKSDREQGIRLW